MLPNIATGVAGRPSGTNTPKPNLDVFSHVMSHKKKPGKDFRPAHSIQNKTSGLVSLGIMLIVVIDARLDFCFCLLG